MAARSPAKANAFVAITSDTDNLPESVGFYASPDGTLSCRAREMAAVEDIPVLAGHFYEIDLAEVDITGSTTTDTVIHCRKHL